MSKQSNIIYGCAPTPIGDVLLCKSDEMFFYQYLPIKMIGNRNPLDVPPQLRCYTKLIRQAIFNFIGEYGLESFKNHYIYITAKRMYVTEGNNLNRPGWHSDGFGTPDINYIWCDAVPTEYIEAHLTNISTDCNKSLKQFEDVGETHRVFGGVKKIKPNILYRLNQSVIHTTGKHTGQPIIRTFIKISFSKNKYNLKGNSHNYLIDYNWTMKDREQQRNHPSK